MQISKLLMVASARYHAPLIRPYQVEMDRYKQNDLDHYTNHGRNLNQQSLAGIAGQILTPTAVGEREAFIPNGWAEPRMQFMMEIIHPSMDGYPIYQYITGYTDHVGYIPGSGHIDPNMRFYLNYSVDTRTVMQETHHGQVPTLRMRSANHLIAGSTYGSGFIGQTNNPNEKYMIRPTDLTQALSMKVEEYKGFDFGASYSVGPSKAGLHIKTSKVNNGLPNRYLANVFKGFKAASNSGSAIKDFGSIMEETSGSLREDPLTKNLFVRELLDQGTSLSESDSFTFRELCDLFPETANNTVVIEHKAHQQSNFGMAGTDFVNYTSDFHSPNYQVVTATMLSNALPGLLMDLMLTRISFNCTNKTLDGQPYLTIFGYGSFASIELERYVEVFKTNFLSELWPSLSKNNEIDLTVNVQFDIVSHSSFVIEWQGEPPMHFAVPSFTDSLFAPVITGKQTHAEEISVDFEKVLNCVQSVPEYTEYQQDPGEFYHTNGFGTDNSNNPSYNMF